MDAAIATLLGALVGGCASLAGTELTQRRQLRLDGEARKREHSERALTAARIVLGDLAWSRDRVALAIKGQKYWSERYELLDASWVQYRETLATCLNGATDWWTVHDAFRAIRALRAHASKQRGQNQQLQAPFDKWAIALAARKLEQINAAIALLELLAERRMGEEAARSPR
jgi:hypothetical protein